MTQPTPHGSRSRVTAKGFVHPACPPGMEPLLGTSAIIVRQMVDMAEAFFGFNVNKRYEIMDMRGQRMFLAAEETSGLIRAFTKGNRAFTILILDNYGRLILKIARNLMWNTVKMHAGNGAYMGKITQDLAGPIYTICDGNDIGVLKIRGSMIDACCGCDFGEVTYDVENMQGGHIGVIQKNWSGFMQEAYTRADNFGVGFPQNMDVRLKTLMLGAVFLIDFMYFER